MLNLEWYGLIRAKEGKYELAFPVIKAEKLQEIEKYALKFAESWIKVATQLKSEIGSKFGDIDKKTPFSEVLIDKAVEKLHDLLKAEKLLPNIPNIRALWAEQLRKIKFEEWIANNF